MTPYLANIALPLPQIISRTQIEKIHKYLRLAEETKCNRRNSKETAPKFDHPELVQEPVGVKCDQKDPNKDNNSNNYQLYCMPVYAPTAV